MKKQTQAIHVAYERRDAYDSLSVPVYNTLAYEFDNAAIMSDAFTDKIKAPDYSRVEKSYGYQPGTPHRGTDRGPACYSLQFGYGCYPPIATVAAFRKGEEWRRQMLAYIEDNIRFVEDFCKANIPAIRPLRPQASFLIWLNCRDLNLSHDQLLDLFIDKAHLALNDGEMFGPGGEGFRRLNVAVPRSVLEQALLQLEEAVRGLG